jgi:hypothetical protein
VGATASGDYVFWYGNAFNPPTMGRAKLHIVDVSDPSAPEEVFTALDPPLVDNCIMGLCIEENYAYIGVGPRLVVADISDPKELSVVGSTEVEPCRLTDVAVAGGYAFLASQRGGLRALDVSDAESPKEVGSLLAPGAITTVAAADKYVFAGEQGLLHVLDASDPKALREVTTYKTGGPATETAVAGNYACVWVGGATVKILDLSEPTSPKEVATYELPIPASAFVGGQDRQTTRLAASDDRLFVCGERLGGLRVFDLSCLPWTVRMPYLVALALAASIGLALLMLLIRRSLNRYLLLPALIVVALPPALLLLVPRAPREIGRCSPPGRVLDLDVAGSSAYIVGGRHDLSASCLWVVDISDPAAPKVIDSYDTPIPFPGMGARNEFVAHQAIAVVGRYALVTHG